MRLIIIILCQLYASGLIAQTEAAPEYLEDISVESHEKSQPTFEKQKGDDQLIDEMQSEVEKDLEGKYEEERRVKKVLKRLKLPANSPGSRKPEDAPILEQMGDFHAELSDDVVSIADNIDSFFANREVIDGQNHTHARLSNSFIFLNGEGFKNEFDFKFRLKLPQLQEKVALEFEDDFDESELTDNGARRAQISRTGSTSGTRGGLSYYENLWGIQSKLTGGLEYKDGVVGYWRFRVMKNFVLTSNSKITALHDVFDDTRDRKGQTAIINYDYSFNRFHVLRFVNEETYKDEFNTFETAHGLSFFQQINDKVSLSYDYRARSINRPSSSAFYLDMHVVDVIYRKLLYRQHVYGEIGPAIFFPKIKDFEAQPGITFKIELIFGNN